MALLNRGFETAGATPGLAANWTRTVIGTAETLADFSGGVGLPNPTETYEAGWSNDTYQTQLGPSDVTLAVFNTGVQAAPIETFEVQWSNNGYLTSLGSAIGAAFNGTDPVETFEVGWSNDTYQTQLGPSDVTEAAFPAAGTENFEAGWANDTYETTITSPLAAVFDGPNAEAVEDFEEVLPRLAFSADPVNGWFLCAAHGMPNNTPVQVKGPGLPTGFAAGIVYWIVSSTTNTFKLSLTMGGSAIVLTSDGSGTVFGDPARYWNDVA